MKGSQLDELILLRGDLVALQKMSNLFLCPFFHSTFIKNQKNIGAKIFGHFSCGCLYLDCHSTQGSCSF